MSRRILLAGIFTILVARGDTIFSNLTSATGSGGYDICGTASLCSPGQALAQQFTSGGDFTLTDVTITVGNQNGTSPLFNAWLAHDSFGLPGSLIEQIGFSISYSGTDVVATGGTGGQVTANSIATPLVLTSGTSYWLVLTPAASTTVVYWDTGGPSSVPLLYPCFFCFALTNNVAGTGGWFLLGGHTGGQMQINGTPYTPPPDPPFEPPPVITPEPGTFYLCVGVLASLFVISAHKRRAAMTAISSLARNSHLV